MRSVVLTDAIQGILLLITIQIIFFVILSEYGINTNFDSYSASKIAQTPDNAQQITWISTIILLFLVLQYTHKPFKEFLWQKSF